MDITTSLKAIAKQYPAPVIDKQLFDIPRMAFNVSLVLDRKGRNCTVCDLGGGSGFFAIGCASIGLKAVLVDDFNDPANAEYGHGPEHLYKQYDVKVVCQDLTSTPLPFECESFDVVTSFDSMEHWHNSPKKLLSEVMRVLKHSGYFILGVPNCVNLRKRLTVPLGIGKWSQMEDWYEQPIF